DRDGAPGRALRPRPQLLELAHERGPPRARACRRHARLDDDRRRPPPDRAPLVASLLGELPRPAPGDVQPGRLLQADGRRGASPAELGALLARADVLVTPDTGPMHMAVAVGTPVVALFFGPALPFDTGPYAADHVCLHAEVACAPCDHNVTCLEPFCRDTLAPE